MTVGSGASTNTGCSRGGPHATRTTFACHAAKDVADADVGTLPHNRKNDFEQPCKATVPYGPPDDVCRALLRSLVRGNVASRLQQPTQRTGCPQHASTLVT